MGRNEENEKINKAFSFVYLLYKHLIRKCTHEFESEILETAKVCISASSYRRKRMIALCLIRETNFDFLKLDVAGSFFTLLVESAMHGTMEYKGKEGKKKQKKTNKERITFFFPFFFLKKMFSNVLE